jgi:hypothetical protein
VPSQSAPDFSWTAPEGTIIEQDGKFYKGRRVRASSKPDWQMPAYKTIFEPYDPPNAPAPAPEPVAAPPPAPAPAPAPTISDEAKQYRAETLKIYQDAEAMIDQFKIDQKNATDAAEAAAATAAARSANEERAGRAANLQIQQAEQQPTTMGTQAFKRRKNQFNVSNAYGGLSKIASGMVNL